MFDLKILSLLFNENSSGLLRGVSRPEKKIQLLTP
jgi:hypothetical protein